MGAGFDRELVLAPVPTEAQDELKSEQSYTNLRKTIDPVADTRRW